MSLLEHEAVKTGNADELWRKYKTDKSVKQQLVLHYLYLVKKVVIRMIPAYGGYVDMDDLVSCGVIGLMDAIDKYDVSKNIDFEVFSKHRISGEIIDNLRRMDWASVSLRGRIKQMNKAMEDLQTELGRKPMDEEIADRMEISVDKLLKLKTRVHMFNIVHFESIISDDEGNSVSIGDLVKDESTHDISDDLQKEELSKVLAGSIDKLNEKEQLVVKLYYYEELKFKEIAAVLDVTESRVSQIHSNALNKLRKSLGRYNEEDGE